MTTVLDTNVLLYAMGDPGHRLNEPARAVLRAAAHRADIVTSPLVLQEFLHVRSRRVGRDDALRLGSMAVDLLAPLVDVRGEQAAAMLRIFGGGTLGAADALLAASVAAIGATLVTADRRLLDTIGVRTSSIESAAATLADAIPGDDTT